MGKTYKDRRDKPEVEDPKRPSKRKVPKRTPKRRNTIDERVIEMGFM